MEMDKEATGGIERAKMEMITGHKRLAAEQEEMSDEPKRPRDDDEEEEEMLADLAEWRTNWENIWSDYFGSVEKRSA